MEGGALLTTGGPARPGGAMGTHGGTIPAGSRPGWYAAVIRPVAGASVLLGLGTPAAPG